jgi:hypothetical protein
MGDVLDELRGLSRCDHSDRADLRTMCGSRTGGWSLPCVMSD